MSDLVIGEQEKLKVELRLLRSEAGNFAARFIRDSGVRARYQYQVSRAIEQLWRQAQANPRSASEMAKLAHAERNEIMRLARMQLSDIGLAISRRIKQEGLTLPQLTAKNAELLFNRSFETLHAAEQERVYLAIVESAARPRQTVNHLAKSMRFAGRALLPATLAITVYNIFDAEDKLVAVAHEASSITTGYMGSVAGGAVAGALCVAATPVCATVITMGVFVGGVLGALSVDYAHLWAHH